VAPLTRHHQLLFLELLAVVLHSAQQKDPLLTLSFICSDARLFCKNKQANLQNKPKMGNLTEKQAKRAFGW